jgi:hypothetical protein
MKILEANDRVLMVHEGEFNIQYQNDWLEYTINNFDSAVIALEALQAVSIKEVEIKEYVKFALIFDNTVQQITNNPFPVSAPFFWRGISSDEQVREGYKVNGHFFAVEENLTLSDLMAKRIAELDVKAKQSIVVNIKKSNVIISKLADQIIPILYRKHSLLKIKQESMQEDGNIYELTDKDGRSISLDLPSIGLLIIEIEEALDNRENLVMSYYSQLKATQTKEEIRAITDIISLPDSLDVNLI